MIVGSTGGPVNDVWEWDGSTWSEVSPSLDRPLAGVMGTMATFDTKRNRTVDDLKHILERTRKI